MNANEMKECCRWAFIEMDWKFCPDCGASSDPLKAFKKQLSDELDDSPMKVDPREIIYGPSKHNPPRPDAFKNDI